MAEFKIGRLKYTWRGGWTTGTSYITDDVVSYGGKVYVCLLPHAASANIYADITYVPPGESEITPRWVQMLDGFKWVGNWTNSTYYNIGDIVLDGGTAYRCTSGHTSGLTLAVDFSKWTTHIQGAKLIGDWTSSTTYMAGQVVRAGGNVYRAVTEHVAAAQFETDQTAGRWETELEGVEYRGLWVNYTRYKYNDLVNYGSNIWRALRGHDGGFNVGTDWELYIPGQKFVGEWTQATQYVTNDIVRHGGNLYIALALPIDPVTLLPESTSPDNNPNWQLALEAYKFEGDWDSTASYGPGHLVRRGGNLYVALKDSTGVEPSDSSSFDGSTLGTAHWEVVIPGENWKNFWQEGVDYGVNDIVQFDANAYRCIVSNTSNTSNFPENGNGEDYWEILVEGNNANGMTRKGDLTVRDTSTDGSTLKNNRVPVGRVNEVLVVAPTEFGSTYGSETLTVTIVPANPNDGIGNRYVIDGVYRPNLELKVGNTYVFEFPESAVHPMLLSTTDDGEWNGGIAFNEYVTYKFDTSPVNPDVWADLTQWAAATTRTLTVKITETTPPLYYYCDLHPNMGGELIIVNEGHSVTYKTAGQIKRNYYVALHGSDEPGYGLTPDRPFRTVRYATEVVVGFPVTINVAPGRYEETLPIIVPAETSIVGSELRSTTLVAAPAVTSLANDTDYTIAVLERFREIIQDLITNQPITKSVGNALTQNTSLDAGSVAASATISFLFQDMIDYISWKVDDTSAAQPSVTGTNTRQILDEYLKAHAILTANKEFLASEAVAFMINYDPAYYFDSEKCKRDVRRYIEAVQYDILFPGNYKSVLAARYYTNAVFGSHLEDFFYARNSTSLKDMTLEGLNGILSPYVTLINAGSFEIGQSYTIVTLGDTDWTSIGAARQEVGIVFEATGAGAGTGTANTNVVELVRRPSAGAYVSLDPGWGPNDERVWISTRSPYIQNITTLGYGAIGQKVDGSLHNGGYKSIVSNDFTQLISDGIGAWVTNDGKAELVSVFTYYSHIGYLTESGGIIRGTNGNNSYGLYGSVATGVLSSETPLTGTINNRNQEAIVADAFAGESADELLVFEFQNAGQNYSTVDYTIVGSGYGATLVTDEFRDGGVFDVHITDPDNGDQPGGGGYTIAGNNAQAGNTTQITLASNDPNQETDYLGMRIIITSGTGTGQYGYITSYDDDLGGNTKVVTVSRESDDQPGWDHVIPGRPSSNPLDTTTFYVIEPRPTFTAPPFTATNVDSLPSSLNWTAIDFANDLIEEFPSREATLGTGPTIDVPPEAAEFTVTKTGTEYAVVNTVGGAGYTIGDVLTIAGTELGGLSPANDITIAVTEVSEDSTNSIVNFTFEGIGRAGKFIAAARGNNTGVYSRDGLTWETMALPGSNTSDTDWLFAHGGNKFVTIRSGTNVAGYSSDGITWTQVTLPTAKTWSDLAYGDGTWIAVSPQTNTYIRSTNGTTWTAETFPDLIADSTIGDWTSVAYGKGTFVAICKDTTTAAYSTDDGVTWTQTFVNTDSTIGQWVSATYGNGRFVAISEQQNAAAYSFDGITWYAVDLPSQDGSTSHLWKNVSYGQGLFMAVGTTGARDVGADPTTGPTTFAATSEDGVLWTGRTLSSSKEWANVAFGNPGNDPMWITTCEGTMTNKIRTGARTKGRVVIISGRIGSVKIWEPGSGYVTGPTLTFTDPSNTSDAVFENRIGNGVLAQPDFVNRGTGYRTSSTVVTVVANATGFADIIPITKYVTISNLLRYPKLGSNLEIAGVNDSNGDPVTFTIVTLRELGGAAGTYSAYIQTAPILDLLDDVQHGTAVSIREKFSQIRLTGHDFLDIGIGNFTQSNYPTTLSASQPASQENETTALNGGRVFYTSSDQDGNFRVGELFQVEQASGVVTVSADFFDLNGLSELSLGGVRLGGTGTVIREFSTDPLFTADSNNVIPTQRAIKAYLTRRLTIGGSEVSTGTLTAGVTVVGPNKLATTTGAKINLPVKMQLSGPRAGVAGLFVGQMMFYKSFRDD